MKDSNKVPIWIVLAVLVGVVGSSLLWGHCMYGDWKCGVPDVQCRKVVP